MAAPMDGMERTDIPQLEENDVSDNDSDWEEELDEENQEALCLFCKRTFQGATATLKHCSDSHAFDIVKLQQRLNLDCFGYIKMINYIRKLEPAVGLFKQVASQQPHPWEDDSYMKPEVEDDPLLQFDVEDMTPDMFEADCVVNCASEGDDPGGDMSIPMQKYSLLLQRLQRAENRAREAEEHLQQTLLDMQQMRKAAQNLVMTSPAELAPTHRAIQCLQPGEDETYVDSYSHFSIHQEMLQDKIRTESYRDAVYHNKEFFEGKVVLDIGCGSGILSMFAAKAGASKVVAVEMSEIAYQAMDIVRENKLEDVITVVKGRLEDVEMPVEEFDVVISEWMGYFLLFESMLDTVLYARDRWLKPGGVLLPDRCSLHLVASADPALHERNVQYWEDVYGFGMNCMRAAVIQEASVMLVNPKFIVTDACMIKDVDVSKAVTSDLEFTSPFKLTAKDSCTVTALVGYFDTSFGALHNKVQFSTGPSAPATHWKQTVFLLHKPLDLAQGASIEGQLICRKNRKDPRSLKVSISIDSETFQYLVQ